MGEVYRARDTKLDRHVAIKVLPAPLANDPERLARFEHEAKLLASLNHPNIAQIYGVEDRALVMELVEGASPKGPMAFDEACSGNSPRRVRTYVSDSPAESEQALDGSDGAGPRDWSQAGRDAFQPLPDDLCPCKRLT
jgi:serine/threonine protein kinase